jgi:hypothetical protein
MKLLLIISLLIFTSVVFISHANDETIDCIDGKIKYFENKKVVIVKDRYCFDSILKTISSTKKCPKGCLVDNLEPIQVMHGELSSEIDSPMFIICRKAKGVPQIIEYWANNNWVATTRCLFTDGSYQDINRLISSRVRYED